MPEPRATKGRRPRLSGLALAALVLGCDPSTTSPEETAPPAPPSRSATPPSPDKPATLPTSPPAAPARVCPADMELVAGAYCPRLAQVCLEKPRIPGTNSFGQCKRYAPARCLSTAREPLRFCMDRYEWPNRKGERPRTLVSWPEAKSLCEARGKRLCTEDEFNFACEGEEMRAHVYGNERDDTRCNFDRPYRARSYDYEPWEACMAKPACKAEYDRLDQRVPAGSMPGCVSPQGIFDLNGNANEWVHRTDQRAPRRSGLKGGWWGPVRNRCRPMTTFHLEGDYGYETGFRCCLDPPAR